MPEQENIHSENRSEQDLQNVTDFDESDIDENLSDNSKVPNISNINPNYSVF